MTSRLTLAAGAAALALIAPAVASANSAIQFFGTGTTFDAFSTDETVGWAFTANQALSVTKFGWFVLNPSLSSDHQVGMWDMSGNLLAQTTVLAPGPGSSDGFRYVAAPFTPFQLTAGQTYVIGGREVITDGDRYVTGVSFIQTDPAITFVGSATSAAATGFRFPATITPGGRGRFGPNFLFDVVPTSNAVPEPATWAMMILGFGLAGAAVRSRRRPAAAG